METIEKEQQAETFAELLSAAKLGFQALVDAKGIATAIEKLEVAIKKAEMENES